MPDGCTLTEKPVIAKTDLFILVVSASLLATGIFRWQSNMSAMAANSSQARTNSATVPVSTPKRTAVVSVIADNSNAAISTITSVTSVQTSGSVNNSSAGQVVVRTSNSQSNTVVPIVVTDPPLDTRPLYGSYIVVSGDYLSKIAQNYGTSVRALQEINGIDGTLIDVGQLIQYPLPAN